METQILTRISIYDFVTRRLRTVFPLLQRISRVTSRGLEQTTEKSWNVVFFQGFFIRAILQKRSKGMNHAINFGEEMSKGLRMKRVALLPFYLSLPLEMKDYSLKMRIHLLSMRVSALSQYGKEVPKSFSRIHESCHDGSFRR